MPKDAQDALINSENLSDDSDQEGVPIERPPHKKKKRNQRTER
jgi:hypothetical protein